MDTKVDRRIEALKELAAMIVERRMRELKGDIIPLKSDSRNSKFANIPYTVEIDSDGHYCEIIKIEDLLGRKPRQRRRKPDVNVNQSEST